MRVSCSAHMQPSKIHAVRAPQVRPAVARGGKAILNSYALYVRNTARPAASRGEREAIELEHLPSKVYPHGCATRGRLARVLPPTHMIGFE